MYAVIKTGGKQYRVQPGDTIVVEKLEGDAGAELTLGSVLMLGGDNGVTLADLPALREIAEALPVTELDHPMTTAARLLLWERGRKATR